MPKTYSMKAFIEQMTDETIRCDADTQRYSEQWSTAEKNELIVTILTDDHVPEIILGEEKLEEGWRSSGLLMDCREVRCARNFVVMDTRLPHRLKILSLSIRRNAKTKRAHPARR